MTRRVLVIGGTLVATLVVGTWRDRAPARTDVVLDGYHVLAVDFHVHTHPFSASTLAPWDAVAEARRARLDAIAVVPHDHVWAAKLTRWCSALVDGPIVLVGEENSATQCDLLAVGITRTIPWGLPTSAAADQAHQQGGVAIAAHAVPREWPGCVEGLEALDGSEVVHPLVFGNAEGAAGLRELYARRPMAAIGDTDYHIGPFGIIRTYVFALERSADGILEAVRQRRTVVYDRGRAYGDARLVALAAADGRVPRMAMAAVQRRRGTIDGLIAIAALLGAVLFGAREERQNAEPAEKT